MPRSLLILNEWKSPLCFCGKIKSSSSYMKKLDRGDKAKVRRTFAVAFTEECIFYDGLS